MLLKVALARRFNGDAQDGYRSRPEYSRPEARDWAAVCTRDETARRVSCSGQRVSRCASECLCNRHGVSLNTEREREWRGEATLGAIAMVSIERGSRPL